MSRTGTLGLGLAAFAASAAPLASTGVVTIICRRPGMRRRGIAHPATETYPADRWTEEDLAAFRADPAFAVQVAQESAVAPGADTADAVRDNGAGPPQPDLGAKPDGTGPAAPVVTPSGTITPPVFDDNRIAAIRGRLEELVFLRPESQPVGEPIDFAATTDEQWVKAEHLLGFRPTIEEMTAAIAELATPPVVEGTPPIATQSERLAAIRTAIAQLVAPEGFISSGKPSIEAVEKIVGFRTTRGEIDRAQAPVQDA